MNARALPLLALAGALVASTAGAQTPLPPSLAAERAGEPEPARKPAPKPRAKAKPADGAERAKAAKPAPPQRGYPETLPLPRRIDRGDIADPYGGTTSGSDNRMAPMMMPSGRPGMGARF